MNFEKEKKYIPLKVRQKIGPVIAYFYYKYRMFFEDKNNRPKILSPNETLNKILNEDLSVIRFGDGEISLMDGINLQFQKVDKNLSEKLEEIIEAEDKRLLICIPNIFGNIEMYTKRTYKFTLHHLLKNKKVWNKLLNENYTYGDAFISRPYINYKDKNQAEEIFDKLKLVWKDKNVVLIEGEKSRLGIGNDLFDNAQRLERILCPSENAFDKYKKIIEVAKKQSKEKLILISLGPTAKVIAYELFKQGYRVIDIGHIDMEYEMFKRSSDKIVKVEGKYFNEIDERNPVECTDQKYLDQIIENIK